MAEFTEADRKILYETHDKVSVIETTIRGINGRSGLLTDIHDNKERIHTNAKSITNIKIFLAALLGGGGFAAGIIKVIESLS